MPHPTPHCKPRHPYRHWLYILLLPLYLLGFAVIERIVDGSSPYLVSYMPIDDRIPFCEWFVIFYVLWYPFMGSIGIYLALKEPAGFVRYMQYIGATFLSSLVLFLLFPNGQDLRPALDALGRENLATQMVGSIYTVDTHTNVCPSLHVVGSIAAVLGILHSRRLRQTVWMPIGGIVLAVLIIASTVLIKQHSLLDVLVGVAYALVFYLPIYRPWRRIRPLRDENS